MSASIVPRLLKIPVQLAACSCALIVGRRNISMKIPIIMAIKRPTIILTGIPPCPLEVQFEEITL
jgi:hypothetical protein